MTKRTIRWISLSSVVRVRSTVVIPHMAGVALRRGASVPVRMALDATRARVLAGQRESGVVMVKGGRNPGRGIVTLCTIRWEPGLHVVRRCGCIVIGDVAGCTIRWRSCEAVRVALHAIHGGV